MRLVDLDPRWLLKDGQRIGFMFRSPTHDRFYQSCFPVPPIKVSEQLSLFYEHSKGENLTVQPMNPHARWQIQGGIENATFETMTVTPSLDGSAGGLWHGFITNGQIVGGI